MTLPEIYQHFIEGIKATTWLEFVAVAFGIVSVLYSRKENILVYPTGIINTVLYTWFCFGWWGLYAEGSLNFYYTVMSIYGWILWSRKKGGGTEKQLRITKSTNKEWLFSLVFFVICYVVLYWVLSRYTRSTVPMADAFASAAAYTGMLLMARKKLENWLWWILTNLASIPLYFYKGAVFTSFQYVVFFVLAIMGYITWKKKIHAGTA
ncbi:MAG: nicotinamide riboside transporter PnuC [Chitinophagaceae bacterium]